MAVLPILEQKHSKTIIKTLLEKERTVKELNEYFIYSAKVDISTATLYRRVKELDLVGLIEKQENGTYKVTELGKTAYNEIYGKNRSKKSKHGSYLSIINQLSKRESYLLFKLQNQNYYLSEFMSDLSISPNTLVESLRNLRNLGLVIVDKDKIHKYGRPKEKYQLTTLGKQILKEIEELKKKLSW